MLGHNHNANHFKWAAVDSYYHYRICNYDYCPTFRVNTETDACIQLFGGGIGCQNIEPYGFLPLSRAKFKFFAIKRFPTP